jgi:hypothetical protein
MRGGGGGVRGAAAAMATAPRGIRTWRRNLERLRAARGRTGAGGSSRRDVGVRDDNGALTSLQLPLSVIQ